MVTVLAWPVVVLLVGLALTTVLEKWIRHCGEQLATKHELRTESKAFAALLKHAEDADNAMAKRLEALEERVAKVDARTATPFAGHLPPGLRPRVAP